MDLVAGPQGGGKSTFFPVADRGGDSFNADDRRRQLNRGSSRKIPPHVRRQVVAEYEAFINEHIERGSSFSIEVTLAKQITFEQARRARERGFRLQLTYIAAEVDECINRVANRLDRGGHGVSPAILRETYAASMKNLSRAVREFDLVQVYDNARAAQLDDAPQQIRPALVLETQRGMITFVAPQAPQWLRQAFSGGDYDLG